MVDKETKVFNPMPLFSSKMSWDFSKKSKYDDILNIWKMTFQALDLKRKQFLNLLNEDNNIIKPFYTKEGFWLKIFEYSNSLYACALQAITNHVPIGKYQLRFFSREEFKYLCSSYSIETRHYILYEYNRFNRYWNSKRDSLGHFIIFLVANLSAFVFIDNTSLLVTISSYN